MNLSMFIGHLIVNAAQCWLTERLNWRDWPDQPSHAHMQALAARLRAEEHTAGYGEFLRRPENAAAWQASVAQAKARNARLN